MTIPDISLRQELIIAILWLFGAVATDMVAISALVLSHGFRRWKWALLSIAAIFLSFFCMRRVVLEIPRVWLTRSGAFSVSSERWPLEPSSSISTSPGRSRPA